MTSVASTSEQDNEISVVADGLNAVLQKQLNNKLNVAEPAADAPSIPDAPAVEAVAEAVPAPVEASAPVEAPAADAGVEDSFLASVAPPAPVAEPVAEEKKEEVTMAYAPPRKDAFIAAAEKERMLKMIRDAAARRLEDGQLDLRVMMRSGMSQTKAETVQPAPAPVDAVAVTPMGEPEQAAPEADTGSSVGLELAGEMAGTAEVVEVETVVTEPGDAEASTDEAAETAEGTTLVPPTPHPVMPSVRTVSGAYAGALVPPPHRAPHSTTRSRSESAARASSHQARINEAYLRQLKGEGALTDEEMLVAETMLRQQQRRDQEAAGVGHEVHEEAAPVQGRRRATRRPLADGSMEVPVESLGTGIANLLGDMVGGVVQATQKVAGKSKATVRTPVDEPVSPQQAAGSTTDSATMRMASRMARGVSGIVSGVGGIIQGGGNVVIGTVGVVTMPVVSAVGSVVKAIRSAGSSAGRAPDVDQE